MHAGGRAGAVVGLTVVAVSLGGCLWPGVETIGAVGVSVDEEQRPVLVLTACSGAAARVELSFDRQGLTADEENESVGVWIARPPVPGTSELALHAPADPWAGEAVEMAADRGYVVSASGDRDTDVLRQVVFRQADLADLEPGTVYTNSSAPDVRELVARSVERFSADTCDRL